MSDRLGRLRLTVSLLGLSAAVAIGLILWLRRGHHAEAAEATAIPLPPYSASRFLNTGTEARYIGVSACAECHRGNHQSYLLTEHSRALADLNPDDEPPDGSFFHKPSGRHYRVYRQNKLLRHEEVVRTPEGKEIARLDLPIRYRIGSGNFTRSYLVEIDGFLHESPITWYRSTKSWAMSPGYDHPRHDSFERIAEVKCLSCHAGRVEAADRTVHRMILHEKAIGCENCHGPGSLHQELHRSRGHVTGEDDLTIVNPGKLSRPLQEAICAVCHKAAAATVLLRGRQLTDYRPGMPLTDYRIDYRLDTPREQMTVVGHIEQLRRSACYQKSDNLTCLTCHDPHSREKPKNLIAFYRQKCLSCHTSRPCSIPQVKRLEKDATDNCAGCHMPRGNTDIPHIAFTHHRIGRHGRQQAAHAGMIPELVPTDDVSHLSALDRQRNLGMGYVIASQLPEVSRYADVFLQRAQDLLDAVYAAGIRDGETAAALTEIYRRKDPERAQEYARQVVEARDSPVFFRSQILNLLARSEIQAGNCKSAVTRLEEAVLLRRSAEDWRLLGVSYLEQGIPLKALPAFHQALAIRPFRPSIQAGMADAYKQLGDLQHSDEHGERARWLYQHGQD
jgi:predicted CXXCH cytochrome family protein